MNNGVVESEKWINLVSPPPIDKICIVAPNVHLGEMMAHEIDSTGDEQFKVIWPGSSIYGYRFANIYISSSTHRDITRGSPHTQDWWNHLITRLALGGQVIILR